MTKESQREWDEYFMKLADTAAMKSKDPSSKNGCVIVDENRRVVSLGYNGLIQGADESKMTLSERPMKYFFSIHSEMNALLFARRDLKGCTIYNRMATCENCLKYCLQAGIRRFVYQQFRYNSRLRHAKLSMSNIDTDEAIVRMLVAMPEVETLNITNCKSYIEEILDDYAKDSPEYQRLIRWVSSGE